MEEREITRSAEDELAASMEEGPPQQERVGGDPDGEPGEPPAELGEKSPEPENPNKKWYVIHTYSGYENKVKANLERRVKTMEKEDKIFRVLVPTEEEYEFKDGKKKIVKKKIFPGYVLVEMVMEDDSWYVVRNTPGVTGFVGSGSRPVPLQETEMHDILRRIGVEEARPKIDFSVGEGVRVISGPFQHFSGIIEEIQPDKGKARVLVSMFGRDTPVELDFSQIEKL
ncbi:MAG: transcription termination/antitermination protein NusG [Bacillota bacterium]|nr:transcription termination/antitermination protein NusG [Bacillota bacterium]